MFTKFRDIIELWSSPDELAAELGVGVERARKWRQRDSIPAEFWLGIVNLPKAREAGITVDLLARLAAKDAAPPPDLAEAS